MPRTGGPQRTCVGCGASRGKDEMVRVVADPSGQAVFDLKGRLPSRGAYVCPSQRCLEKAARGRLAASLRRPGLRGAAAAELVRALGDAFRGRALALVGLAQRGGRAVSGAELVGEEVRRGPARGWLALVAEDASAETAGALERRLNAAGVRRERALSKDELGLAIGRSPRSVVLVRDAGLAEAILEALFRYREVQGRERQGGSGE